MKEIVVGDKMMIEMPTYLREIQATRKFYEEMAEWVNTFEQSKTKKIKFIFMDYYGVCWFRIKDK